MAELAHWDGWALDVWFGWVEEEGEPEPEPEPPAPAAGGPSFNVWDVGLVQRPMRPRKRLKYRVLLLG